MQKLLAFFLAMLLSVSIIAGCGSNSPKTNDKQTTQTTTVNTTKSNNGQNTAANVKANSLPDTVQHRQNQNQRKCCLYRQGARCCLYQRI